EALRAVAARRARRLRAGRSLRGRLAWLRRGVPVRAARRAAVAGRRQLGDAQLLAVGRPRRRRRGATRAPPRAAAAAGRRPARPGDALPGAAVGRPPREPDARPARPRRPGGRGAAAPRRPVAARPPPPRLRTPRR